MRWQRVVAAATGPAGLVAAAGAAMAWAGRVPDPMATHFSPVRADDATAVAPMVTVALAVVAAAAGVATWAALSGRPGRDSRRMLVAGGVWAAWLGALLLAVTLWVQRDLASWRDARLGPWWMLLVLGLPVALAAWTGRACVAGIAPAASPRPAGTRMSLREGQRAVWSSTLRLPWMVGAGALAVAAGVASAFVAPVWVALLVVPLGLAALALGMIRVSVDARGLRVRYGPLGWPVTRIPAGDVDTAEAIDVNPMAWGGWGYRGSLRVFGRAAVVLRRGPGILVHLRDGDRFVVTVDDAATGAALLDAEAARAH